MPKRYIDAEAFKLKTQVEMTEEKSLKPTDANFHNFLDAIYSLIARGVDEMPTADVVERKKGKWVKLYSDTFHCRLCGSTFIVLQGKDSMNYCPSCGVDMRGEHDAETN